MSQERSVAESTVAGQAILGLRPKRTVWQHIGNFFRRKPLGAFGAVVAGLLVIFAVFAPIIAPTDAMLTRSDFVRMSPGSEAWFGGDSLGRDVYTRVVYGARISLYVGILSSFFGVGIGLVLGVVSVHYAGLTDLFLQRIVDAMMAFPALILAIAIMASLGSSVNNVVIALSIIYIPSTARILRSQALAIKEMDYILAASAVGAGHWRTIIKHMIPNCFAVFIVILTFHFGGAIVAEASLSFLGIGAAPDDPSWGGMLRGAAAQYVRVAPWLGIFPGLSIAVVVFAWNLLGDSLRDVLDPRLRGTT